MGSPLRTVLLVPRRNDHGHRDELWDWCRERWERYFPDIEVVEGHHEDGPFNRSAAINRSAELAGDWDVGIVIDSDVFLRVSQVRTAIDRARRTGRVTWGHRRWRGFSEDQTRRVLNPKAPIDFGAEVDHDDMDIFVERTTPISWSCCIVFPRSVWDDIGGFDERFIGWGFEDMACKSVVTGLYGWERIEGDVYHLWHPRSGERIVKGQPAETASREYLTNARLGRRYMVAVIRDHGVGDQPGEEALSPELRARHVANLQRDDRKLVMYALRYGLPDWTDWWPTLEELRDGARQYIAEQAAGSVTIVLTSGGTAETWPVRRDYLRQSLASLVEQVSGPIVQRVVYADWPDGIRQEVDGIAREFGFYVAGEGQHGHTGMRQRMWKYLAKRAQGSYIFAVEDDFTYERPVDLSEMIAALRANPHLVQVALLRDACYEDERQLELIGNILGWPEPAFTRKDGWLEQREFWTNNPSLFDRTLTDIPWPVTGENPVTGKGPGSEVIFGRGLFRDRDKRSAFWGSGEAWITHIGQVRAGTGY